MTIVGTAERARDGGEYQICHGVVYLSASDPAPRQLFQAEDPKKGHFHCDLTDA